ncbi:hypothetical protein AKJ09_04679 [Labilithrix luteola]|uniref:Uncharacterized protein n=1 Tax=Labilithrix luteola TaxID=1391654 RepID=A0A0K1PWV7_9BACT|nr:hypothetical protein AKJ09_04679 [Labilithrix luteola]
MIWAEGGTTQKPSSSSTSERRGHAYGRSACAPIHPASFPSGQIDRISRWPGSSREAVLDALDRALHAFRGVA